MKYFQFSAEISFILEIFPDFVENFFHKRKIRDKTHLHLRNFLMEGLR